MNERKRVSLECRVKLITSNLRVLCQMQILFWERKNLENIRRYVLKIRNAIVRLFISLAQFLNKKYLA